MGYQRTDADPVGAITLRFFLAPDFLEPPRTPPMASLSALPATKAGTFRAGILIFAPVLGFRPSRAFRLRTLNRPNGVRATSSPFFSADVISSRIRSTISVACRFVSSDSLATESTISAFVNFRISLGGTSTSFGPAAWVLYAGTLRPPSRFSMKNPYFIGSRRATPKDRNRRRSR